MRIILALCLVLIASPAFAAEREGPAIATERLYEQEMSRNPNCEFRVERYFRFISGTLQEHPDYMQNPGVHRVWVYCTSRYPASQHVS